MLRPMLPLFLALLMPWSAVPIFAAVTDEHAELERRLHEFLATVDRRATHADFWAEDLIYTSSSGQRFGKAEILAGMDDEESSSASPAEPVRYAAADLTVRLVDRIAIVTFRLIADAADGLRTEYFNTGVFRREGETWRAFTWQATRIPDATE